MIRDVHPEQAAEMRRAFISVIERNAPELKPEKVDHLAGVLVSLASLDLPRLIEELKTRGKDPEEEL